MSPAGNADSRHDRWLSMLLSLLVHGGILALLGWGWWHFRAPKPPPPQQLAIEATVVTDRTVTAAPAPAAVTEAPPVTAAPAPEPVPPAPPQADQAVQERQLAAHRRQEQRAEQQRAAEQARREREEQQALAADAARRKEQEAAARKAKEAADRAAHDKARREAELRAQLAAEERVNAARGSAEQAAWLALIRDRVDRAWIRPPSARAGVNCEVHVTQVPGGVVTGVEIGSCNGDQAVRESIEAAVYRASPLPTPSNPDVFDRDLKFNFHPQD
jgi:colicin import membrane protein